MSQFDVKLLKRARFGLMIAGLAGLMASCGTTAPLDTYSLSAPNSAVTAKSRKSVQILVAAPAALKALDSQNIVVNPASGSIAYLSGAQWGDRLPNIIQSRLVQAYENTGLLGGVGRPGDGLAINYQILTDIREFGIRASTSPQTAVVELAVRVMDDKNGHIRSTKVFRNVVQVRGSGNNAYLAALDQAFEKTAAEIVSWSFLVI
ncbi:ABC-type transport auxiliary lipoprotein family protein [Paenochrobactrum pullorum]|uniref:ABC-type transport auxiliary lipoprotein family protein n=1 Tax=Paenochrobactrum pullorum TaxID=1324351 RepID=UPI0035BC3A0E